MKNILVNSIVLLCTFCLIFSNPHIALAVIYRPGETLNPGCAPNDSDCGVAIEVLPVENGGTGWAHVAEGSILYGKGASALATTSAGTEGQVLLSENGVPTWTPASAIFASSTQNFAGLGSLCLDANKQVVYNFASDACVSSLRATKHNINPFTAPGLETVKLLQPITFSHNDIPERTRYGFVPEDAATITPAIATYDRNGLVSGIDDQAMLAVLVKTAQELNAKIDNLTEELKGSPAPDSQMNGGDSLSTRITAVRTEGGRDPLTIVEEKIADGMQLLADFVVVRITAVRGYFDEVFTKSVHTEELCVQKSDGTDVCLDGNELQSIITASSIPKNLDSSEIPEEIEEELQDKEEAPEHADTTDNNSNDALLAPGTE